MSFYKYHPHSTATLGFPIDSRRPFDDKTTGGFFQWNNKVTANENISAEVDFKIVEVKSRQELYQKLSLDLSIEAKFGLSSSSASLNWEKEIEFSDKSLIYIFYGNKIYSPEVISGNLGLSEAGKSLWQNAIKKKNISKFQRGVGNEVVTRIRRGNNLSLIYSLRCTSSEQKEKVRAKLDYSWTSGSVDIDFRSEVHQIDELTTINVYGYQSGIGTTQVTPKLSDIISVDPGKITSIKEIIKDILGNVSLENRNSSPVVEFNTTQISNIKEILESDYYDDFIKSIELNNLIDIACIELNNEQLANSKKIDDLNILNNSWNKFDFKEGSRLLIEQKLTELKKQESDIIRQFNKCISAQNESDCQITITNVLSLSYSDVLIFPLIIPLSWSNYTVVYQEGFNVDFGSFTTYFYPNIHIKYSVGINFFYILKNDSRVFLINKDKINQIILNNGSLKDFWTTFQQDAHVYIWAWHAPFVEAKRLQLISEHIGKESANQYKLEVILDDGSNHVVVIGNAASPVTVAKENFITVPTEVLSQFVGFESLRIL